MANLKAEICLKKKPTPSTNIPLLLLRKWEQKSKLLKQKDRTFIKIQLNGRFHLNR